jgi:phage tail-like protein
MPDDGVPNCRFYVSIDKDNAAVFTEMSGLQLETVVTEYEEGGHNDFVHKLPGRTKIGNITLKRGIVSTNDFFNWYSEILQGKLKYRNVDVFVYDPEGTELAKWSFRHAYPVKWVGPQLAADGKTAAIETLELAHQGLILV